MISAISAFSNMYAPISRINAGNRILANNNAMNQNVAAVSKQAMSFGSTGVPMQTLAVAQQKEQSLMATTLRDRLLYKIAMKQEEEQIKSKKKLDYMA